MAASSDSFSSNYTDLIVPVLLAAEFAAAPAKGFNFASSRGNLKESLIALGIHCGGKIPDQLRKNVQEKQFNDSFILNVCIFSIIKTFLNLKTNLRAAVI